MINKIAMLVTAAACMGLIALIAPVFAREITATMPFGKPHAMVHNGSVAIRPPELGCSRDPWPYGRDWRPSLGRTQIAKRAQHRIAHAKRADIEYARLWSR
jgi:hypothetical protein